MGASVIAPGPTVHSSLKFDHPDYETATAIGSSATSASGGFRCPPGAAAHLTVPACLETFCQSSAIQSRPVLLTGEQLHEKDEFAGQLLAADSQWRPVPGCGAQRAEPDMHYCAAPGRANGSSNARDAAARSSSSSSAAQQLCSGRPGRHDAGRTSAEHLHSPRVCLYITEVGCATVTRRWPWQASPTTCGSAHPEVALPPRSNSMPNLPSTVASSWQPPHALQDNGLHEQLPYTYRRAYANCPLAFDPFEGDLALLDSPLVQALMVNAL